MKLISTLFFIVVISFIYQYLNAKENMDTSKRLNKEFQDWYNDSSNKKPNNAEFAELFKSRYNQTSSITQTYRGNRAVLVKERTDLVASFPTLHPQLIYNQLGVLDNLEDYFTLKYKKIFSFKYWLDFVVFLPKKIFDYLGFNDLGVISRIANLIYWLFSAFWIFFEDQIIQWIHSLLFK